MNAVHDLIIEQIHSLPKDERSNLLTRLIAEEEDLIDAEDARRILSQTKPDEWIPYSEFRVELGLDK